MLFTDHNDYFVKVAEDRTDQQHATVFTAESLNLWLAFYCDMYGAILVLAVCLFAMIQRKELGAAAVGLAFSNTIQMLIFYTWSVRMAADSISLFSSVEKVGWLATAIPNLEDKNNAADGVGGVGGVQKPGTELATVKFVPMTKNGTIEFSNVWMKYAPTAPFALKGVSFRLEHGEKVCCRLDFRGGCLGLCCILHGLL